MLETICAIRKEENMFIIILENFMEIPEEKRK